MMRTEGKEDRSEQCMAGHYYDNLTTAVNAAAVLISHQDRLESD